MSLNEQRKEQKCYEKKFFPRLTLYNLWSDSQTDKHHYGQSWRLFNFKSAGLKQFVKKRQPIGSSAPVYPDLRQENIKYKLSVKKTIPWYKRNRSLHVKNLLTDGFTTLKFF